MLDFLREINADQLRNRRPLLDNWLRAQVSSDVLHHSLLGGELAVAEVARPTLPLVLRANMSGQVPSLGVELRAIVVLALKDFVAASLRVHSHVLLDVHLSEESLRADVAGEAMIRLVLLATMLDEQRPLRKHQVAVGTLSLLHFVVRREVPREAESVEKAFHALRACVREVLAVPLDLVLSQLKFPSELLVALTAGVRQRVEMQRPVMSVHVALVGELLVAVRLLAADRCDLRLRLVRELFMALEVGRVGVFFGASIDVASESFLKLKFVEFLIEDCWKFLPFWCV